MAGQDVVLSRSAGCMGAGRPACSLARSCGCCKWPRVPATVAFLAAAPNVAVGFLKGEEGEKNKKEQDRSHSLWNEPSKVTQATAITLTGTQELKCLQTDTLTVFTLQERKLFFNELICKLRNQTMSSIIKRERINIREMNKLEEKISKSQGSLLRRLKSDPSWLDAQEKKMWHK